MEEAVLYRKNTKGWLKHIDFIVIDLICLQIAFILAYAIRHDGRSPYPNPLYQNMAIFIELADLIVIVLFESFKNVLKRGFYIEFIHAAKQAFFLILCSSLYLVSMQNGNDFSRIVLYLTAVIYCLLTYPARLGWKRYLKKKMKGIGNRSLLLITSGGIVSDVIQKIRNNNYEMHQLNGIVLVDQDAAGQEIEGIPVVANYEDASDYIRKNWVDEIFVHIEEQYPYPRTLINRCIEMGLTIHTNLAKVTNATGTKQVVEKLWGYSVITTSINNMTTKQAITKRAMDIVFGCIGCIATGLIFLVIAPIIYISSPGPIFFSQTRIGQNGKPFKMYKFRSMYLDAEARKAELMKENKMSGNQMFKLEFDPRIIGNKILPDGRRKTGIGQFIRSTSLDEFPQFFNVLIGNMSCVGFRPILLSEYHEYDYRHKARLASKPGITGMWQVSGRSDVTDFEEIVRLDTEYIRNWSLGLDLKILFKTVAVVLKRDGSM